jgi:cell division control protein 7
MNIINLQKNGLRNRMGTRGFLAPETVFGNKQQGCAVDIWAVGVILLSFFSKRMPVLNMNKFSKLTNETLKELYPLIMLFGIEKMMNIANKNGASLYIPEILNKYILKDSLQSMIVIPVEKEGIDLLYRLLELDQDKRITAKEAKSHSFFNELIK